MEINLKTLKDFIAEVPINLHFIELLNEFEAELREDKDWFESCLKTCCDCSTTKKSCEDCLRYVKKVLGDDEIAE